MAILLAGLSWALYLLTFFIAIEAPLPRERIVPTESWLHPWASAEAGVFSLFMYNELDDIFSGVGPPEGSQPPPEVTLRQRPFSLPDAWTFHYYRPSPEFASGGSTTILPLWPLLLLVNIPAALFTYGYLRTTRRLRTHACLSCGYHLSTLPTCPECGNTP